MAIGITSHLWEYMLKILPRSCHAGIQPMAIVSQGGWGHFLPTWMSLYLFTVHNRMPCARTSRHKVEAR